MSEYVSALIMLAVVSASLAAIGYMLFEYMRQVRSITGSLEDAPSVSYVCYSNGYIYAYNSGGGFKVVGMTIEIYVDGMWVESAYVSSGTLFRVRSDGPVAVLNTDRGVVVVRP